MGFIARFLGMVPKAERGGIRLDEREPWCVSPTRDVARFVRALPLLAPEGSVAYFEDTAESHVATYLRRVAITPQVQVAVGTILPRPDIYHVPVTRESMESLAVFLEESPAGFFCAHCHVYRDSVVLLEWHDAFINEPMYLSRIIGEDVVREFANRIGSTVSSVSL
jgi:hypothetical protein